MTIKLPSDEELAKAFISGKDHITFCDKCKALTNHRLKLNIYPDWATNPRKCDRILFCSLCKKETKLKEGEHGKE